MWRLVLAGVLAVGCKFEPHVQQEQPKDSLPLDRAPVLEPLPIDANTACRASCGDHTCCVTAGETSQTCTLDCSACGTSCTVCPAATGCCKEKCQNCSPLCTT